jgi:hypothetical protein
MLTYYRDPMTYNVIWCHEIPSCVLGETRDVIDIQVFFNGRLVHTTRTQVKSLRRAQAQKFFEVRVAPLMSDIGTPLTKRISDIEGYNDRDWINRARTFRYFVHVVAWNETVIKEEFKVWKYGVFLPIHVRDTEIRSKEMAVMNEYVAAQFQKDAAVGFTITQFGHTENKTVVYPFGFMSEDDAMLMMLKFNGFKMIKL